MAKKPLQVVKVVLPTQREVLLRQLKISDTEFAAQKVSHRANGDPILLQILVQKAILQGLLYQVDGKAVSASQAEALDDIFSVPEYSYLMRVIGIMSGGEDSQMGKAPVPVKLELLAAGTDSSPSEA